MSAPALSWQNGGMKRVPLLALIPVLVLTACGGDGRKPPAEQRGTLHAGKIQGVEWRTPTHAGTTDATGRFTYLAGETVAFSIGDVELGSAPGSPDISLFTLAGLTPPTTERALRRQLDLSIRMATPFTRAMNLDLLLIALDADGNPDNGLDVRDRKAALSGVSLDFDQPTYDFAVQLYSTVRSLVQSIPTFKPVAHLYGLLGLRVPVHAQTRIDTESAIASFATAQWFHYGADGTLASDETDWNADGVIDSRSHYEYDSLGRVTHGNYQEDFDQDQVVDRSFATTSRFDARGRLVGLTQSIDEPYRDTRWTYAIVESAVDELGRTTREVAEVDDGNDGVVDARHVITSEYDAARSRATYSMASDFDDDGVVDSITRTVEQYDTRRRVLSRVTELDELADGAIESRSTETFTYDDAARTMRDVQESDDDGDGTADSRQIYTWQMDRDGNVTAASSATEPLADGHVTWQQATAREFDAFRRVVNTNAVVDDGADGVIEQRQIDTLVYDDVGNVTRRTTDFDADGDGRVDVATSEGFEYGTGGELLASSLEHDVNGDGRVDSRGGTTVTNTLVDDGVLLLTQWYFQRRNPSSVVQ
jgi:hypothetical protein